MPETTFIDQSNTRFTLASENPGKNYNWIFIPGGPGMGASYLQSFIDMLKLPGKCWLMDMPANGDYLSESIPATYNFDSWSDGFIDSIKQFENPIIVGHSFGAMYPLLFPELENIVSGFVVLNSAPKLWMEESARVVKERKLQSIEPAIAAMAANPCEETARTALIACAPYYFPEHTLEQGKALLNDATFNCHAALWWFQKVGEIQYDAKWIPETVKTLIIGGSYDAITPLTVYENDARFQRQNIDIQLIEGAGHLPWLEQPEAIKEKFQKFVSSLT